MATKNPQRSTALTRTAHSVSRATGPPFGDRGTHGSSDWMGERLDKHAQPPPELAPSGGVAIELNPGNDLHRGDAKESKRGQQ
jgi:hypothetical protein